MHFQAAFLEDHPKTFQMRPLGSLYQDIHGRMVY